MPDLSEYRRKRNPRRTPEPVPAEEDLPRGADDVFVIQEHHASRLHWDIRFEREGVLVSWAVPKGLPPEPGKPRLAVHTEDHPLEYATFEGEIPAGEYGGGRMTIWDHGRYEALHWNDHKVEVILHGNRARGRYLFVNRHSPDRRRDWLLQRVDPPDDEREELPAFVAPMCAVEGTLPNLDEEPDWAYEFRWNGMRAQVRVEGGRVTIRNSSGEDVTANFPELRGLGEQLGATEALLDGELVAFEQGRPSPEALARRARTSAAAQAKRLATRIPVWYLAYDLLHLDGHSCLELPYLRRRELLTGLELRGDRWRIPEHYTGNGADVLEAGLANGLRGIVAKRRDAAYRPGRRASDWVEITGVRAQEVVIGGWRPGSGGRAGSFGSLLLGVPEGDGLRYVGTVGTGFTEETLARLTRMLHRLERKRSPFHSVPADRSRDARWVRPDLVGEVVFNGWTAAGRLRSPRWRGLCPEP
ncbi:non-homologous end-joining DNA ligase [Amycolatopsis anabasis]|uniref:non-homologous end-joining DNA ligase n=1 Tax=Amycolatopsis anabasis TaxID=1840409 RepID=UPI00131A899D|nr:non-homologous end-joining DNA ligase [Amycolatopsis anabasis]